jgi:hypothetical protein
MPEARRPITREEAAAYHFRRAGCLRAPRNCDAPRTDDVPCSIAAAGARTIYLVGLSQPAKQHRRCHTMPTRPHAMHNKKPSHHPPPAACSEASSSLRRACSRCSARSDASSRRFSPHSSPSAASSVIASISSRSAASVARSSAQVWRSTTSARYTASTVEPRCIQCDSQARKTPRHCDGFIVPHLHGGRNHTCHWHTILRARQQLAPTPATARHRGTSLHRFAQP